MINHESPAKAESLIGARAFRKTRQTGSWKGPTVLHVMQCYLCNCCQAMQASVWETHFLSTL